MGTKNQTAFKEGSDIYFCPDLDRGAHFKIDTIKNIGENFVLVILRYIGGRWHPGNGQELFEFELPCDFNQEDIECAWSGTISMQRIGSIVFPRA